MAVRKAPSQSSVARASLPTEAVLDASPNAIVAVDSEGRIVYANPHVEETFGWLPRDLIGSSVERLIPNRLWGRHVEHRRGFLAHPSARPMGIGLDLAGRRMDGSEFPVEISLAPVDTPDGRVVYATIVDITARKALEMQLLHAQKMESIGRLAGGIAHDFNNMLFAIRGYADLLLEDLDPASARPFDKEEARRSVMAIDTAADRATSLTSQLLSFSRRQVMHPVELKPAEAILALEPMIRRLIGEQIRLVLALDREGGVVRSDPGQLDQILVNLAVNARDAMPDGGTLTIETSNVVFDEPYAIEHFEVEPGPYVMLAVTDTGHGMDRETRMHVFEPFFTTKEPGKGTGLGLSTIYGIVRQGGGHIWLYSEPGRGTTFKIYFPRVMAAAESPQQPAPAPRKAMAGTVLLVEDEPAVRDVSQHLLERAGYEVVAPEDPRDALALIETTARKFDVLITDVVMPDLPGPELARRAIAARPGIAVVLLSGYNAETTDIADLLDHGAAFASKPLATRDLIRVVGEALGSRGRGR